MKLVDWKVDLWEWMFAFWVETNLHLLQPLWCLTASLTASGQLCCTRLDLDKHPLGSFSVWTFKQKSLLCITCLFGFASFHESARAMGRNISPLWRCWPVLYDSQANRLYCTQRLKCTCERQRLNVSELCSETTFGYFAYHALHFYKCWLTQLKKPLQTWLHLLQALFALFR